ncbi:mitochondrial ribosomal protein L46 isoform 2 [Ectocarpus siliculosus]|uniref:Mitochondrial ribosomal protein L46 isoform 2 n=1 Tax=Ectocarpus siliculosus TaxID=2880 RepID=D7G8Q3_ECTSI|nr:mitochondrial ribosomal protein L46 isoform 2 [Ectocarpus siliculosus]|eukprot:CBJ28077.1 mitochondrial ribosomal protein L46 isoform 2 [Ectocarpus siliculosus]
MFARRCTMLSSSAVRRVKLRPLAVLLAPNCRELSSSNLTKKQQIEGFTIKDRRPPRPRVAKQKRKQYLAERKDAFEAEQEKATSLGLDWGIRSALILERLPVIVEEYTDWQRDFWDLQTKQAHYGAKFPAEMGFKYDDEKSLTMEQVLEQSPVPLAPRRTPADESNDRTTLDRALDERLVLIVKPRSGDEWRLPESAWEPGETIRQTAERTAQQLLLKSATRKGQRDDVAQLHFVGNCPAGWFWRTADEEQGGQHEKFGDKVFINRVQLICGQPTVVKRQAAEHLWVTKHEIGEYLGESMGVYLKHLI